MFHFQPSELDRMTLDDLKFWCKRLEEVAEHGKG